jgi:type VI secretion system protein ImpG
MDARLLRYFNEELRYLREQGAEFAQAFPKIASRLSMEGLEVADPYVERLLEGCAFLAARIQLKQDAEFPRFSHRLLELVYPGFLAPIPAMLVAQITPTPDPNLLNGPTLPRDTTLLGPTTVITDTRCEFRTAQETMLTPLATAGAEYFLNVSDLGLSGFTFDERPRCGVRVRLKLPGGMRVQQLQIDRLRFYLAGQTDTAMQLHELLMSSTVGILVGPPGREGDGRRRCLPGSAISPVGYDDDEAMLPVTLRGLSGIRLLQEYFAFPERFLFFDMSGLRQAFAAIAGDTVELTLLFARVGQALDGVVSSANFALHCVPAINLFPKRTDRIEIDEGRFEFHVVADRTHPLDYEVYDVLGLTGYDDRGGERSFKPLFAPDHSSPAREPGWFTVWREPRQMSDQARREGPRSGYIGTETFVSLVDSEEAPFDLSLRQVAVQARCTNRDLSVFLPSGHGGGGDHLLVEAGIPVHSVRTVAGPSRPSTALREGGIAWRLLNLLSLNYLSLVDTEGGEAAAALRDLLSRFPLGSEPAVRRQIEALQHVQARSVVRRHPSPGPIAFGRGIEVRLTVDELGHEGGSAFLFGAAMHQYLSRHVSMNSFIETVLVSLTRGEVARWRPRAGRRPVLQ